MLLVHLYRETRVCYLGSKGRDALRIAAVIDLASPLARLHLTQKMERREYGEREEEE